MIKQIEELRPELQARHFRDWKLLHGREVELIQIVTAEDVAARVPIRVDRWNHKGVLSAGKQRNTGGICRRVIPTSDVSLHLRGTDQLRMLAAGSGIRAIHCHGRRKRQCRLEAIYTGQLPAAKYAIH